MYEPIISVEDLSSVYPGVVFNDSTTPSKTDVEQFITEATSVIYAAIGNHYHMPIIDENDLVILKSLAKMYVKPYMDAALNRRQTKRLANGDLIVMGVTHREFNERLKQILDGDIPLNTYKKSIIAVSYTSHNGSNFLADKDEAQW